jgi:hypothetical protein
VIRPTIAMLVACMIVASVSRTASIASTQQRAALRPVSDFDKITDQRQRAIALFVEAGKVLRSPRCLNCHPVERAPTQGDDRRPHSPPVTAGEDGHGGPGLPCAGCHGPENATVAEPSPTIQSIPGNPKWALAPASMAWQGQSLAAICAQLKDRTRNGGRSLTEIHDHIAHDRLVAWGWTPGSGRVPAPGTQAALGDLIAAWIAAGAYCPSS